MMQPDALRVVMITRFYLPSIGGVQRHVAGLAQALAAQGLEVHILTESEGREQTYERVDHVHIHRVTRPRFRAIALPIVLLKYLRLIWQVRAHIVHAHGIAHSSSTMAIMAKWLFGVPIIVTWHGTGEKLGDAARVQRTLYQELYLAPLRYSADRYIGVSAEVTKELIRLKMPAERCTTIANGIDTQRFKPVSREDQSALRQLFGLPAAPIVIYTGRLSPEKRVAQLIKIWPSVNQHQPCATLLIVGDGPQAYALKQLAGPNVIFTGSVKEVDRYLQAADIFALLSAAEGLALSMLEALAVGLPVIVTAVGGAPDIIQDQVSGLLIPVDDATALQTALLTLLADADLRNRLGRAARDRVAQAYSIERMTDQTLALYRAVMGAKSR